MQGSETTSNDLKMFMHGFVMRTEEILAEAINKDAVKLRKHVS